jgi:hypothetical protein
VVLDRAPHFLELSVFELALAAGAAERRLFARLADAPEPVLAFAEDVAEGLLPWLEEAAAGFRMPPAAFMT